MQKYGKNEPDIGALNKKFLSIIIKNNLKMFLEFFMFFLFF